MCTVLNNNALMGDSIFVVPFRTRKKRRRWRRRRQRWQWTKKRASEWQKKERHKHKANQIYVYFLCNGHTWSRITTVCFLPLKTMTRKDWILKTDAIRAVEWEIEREGEIERVREMCVDVVKTDEHRIERKKVVACYRLFICPLLWRQISFCWFALMHTQCYHNEICRAPHSKNEGHAVRSPTHQHTHTHTHGWSKCWNFECSRCSEITNRH